MESVPDAKARRAAELERKLELCDSRIRDAAHKVAFELHLPWYLSRLRREGIKGVLQAAAHNVKQNPGVPFEQFANRYIVEAVQLAGQGIRAQRNADSEDHEILAEDMVREALDEFCEQEWCDLIKKFGREELKVLRPYLYERRAELEAWLPLTEVRSILGAEAMRRAILAFEPGYKLIRPLDPYWIAYWMELASYHRQALSPRPSIAKNWGEMDSNKNLAESLGITDKEVA